MNKTRAEMKAQYQALDKTFDQVMGASGALRALKDSYGPRALVFIGCGSGYCLCQSAAFQASCRAGLPGYAFAAGDLMLHAGQYQSMLEHSLIIAPTRSGSTSELLLAFDSIRAAADVKIVAIAAKPGSQAASAADLSIELPWAFDDSVCQTRSVTNLYTADLMVSAILGGDDATLKELRRAIDQGERFIAENEALMERVGQGEWDNVVLLADGEPAGLASEGAMAVTEIAQLHAHHYHILDVRHGPMVLVDDRTLVFALLQDEGLDQQLKLVADCRARGAKVVAYGASNLSPEDADVVVTPKEPFSNTVAGIPFMYLVQQACVSKAAARGIDPDNPEGLTAWIKL